MTETVTDRLSRPERLSILVARDGTDCMHPDCGRPLDFSVTEGPLEVTEDHWMPQSEAYALGWTYEEVWHTDNLRLMHKKCNAKKGNLIPLEDGTLPEKPGRTFKYRRDKRAERPEVCTQCNAGRNLGEEEWCNACGSGPQPARYPKWRQMKSSECDHDLFYCVTCTIYEPDKRRSVFDSLLTGGEGYE